MITLESKKMIGRCNKFVNFNELIYELFYHISYYIETFL